MKSVPPVVFGDLEESVCEHGGGQLHTRVGLHGITQYPESLRTRSRPVHTDLRQAGEFARVVEARACKRARA